MALGFGVTRGTMIRSFLITQAAVAACFPYAGIAGQLPNPRAPSCQSPARRGAIERGGFGGTARVSSSLLLTWSTEFYQSVALQRVR